MPKKGSALTNFRNAFKKSLNADKKLANQKAASEKKDKSSKKKKKDKKDLEALDF